MITSRRSFLSSSLGAAALLNIPLQAADAKSRRFARFDRQARQLLSQMTLEEKIGQMTQPDQMYLQNLDDIEKYHLGSLLSGGDSDPKSGNDLTSWTDLYDKYQSRAMKTKLRIPLVYGVDAVHGHNNVLGAVIFPHNVGLGCTRNAKLVEQAARITSDEVRATGINWAFSPCVTVPQDIRWGRTYEGFSESPDVVKVLGAAAVRGLQRGSLDDPLAVLACSKHFAGDGGTTYGTGMLKHRDSKDRYPLDRGDTRVDEATLKKIHLPGYVTSIAEGVGIHHAVVQQLEWREVLGRPQAADQHPERSDGLRRLSHFGLCGHQRVARLLSAADRAIDQRRDGHGDGARQVPGILQQAAGFGKQRQGVRCPASTTRYCASCA